MGKKKSNARSKENVGEMVKSNENKALSKKRKKGTSSSKFEMNGLQQDMSHQPKSKKAKINEAINMSGQPVNVKEAELGEAGKTNKTRKAKKSKGVKEAAGTHIKDPHVSNSEDEDTKGQQADTNKVKRRHKKKITSYKEKMSDDETKKTVFVGNLPIGTTKQDVSKIFASCGPVETTRIRSIIPKKDKMQKKVAAIKNEISTEFKNSVNAYVKFVDEKSLANAFKLNGTLFGNHRIQVDSCSKNVKYDKKRSVFVGNLSFACTEDALHDYFANCGEVERVRIVRDPRTGSGKGFAFVLFREESAAMLALKLNGDNFENRPLRVGSVQKKFKKDTQTKNNVSLSQNDRTKSKKPKKITKKVKKGFPSKKVTSFMT